MEKTYIKIITVEPQRTHPTVADMEEDIDFLPQCSNNTLYKFVEFF